MKPISTIAFYVITTMVCLDQDNSILNYYPLHVGNFWQYKSISKSPYGNRDTSYYTITVPNDTMVQNGKKYFIFESSANKSYHPTFQRIDSLTYQVFAFDTSNGGKEFIIDSLASTRRSVFTGCRIPSIPKTIFISIDSQYYFGRYLPTRHYGTVAGLIGYSIEYNLTDGIGLTKISVSLVASDEPSLVYLTEDSLTYANINGNENGTLVSVSYVMEIPKQYIVSQNYPNPFNPSTTIAYDLPVSQLVNVTIYDCLGRKIQTLVNGFRNSGHHEQLFDAQGLNSGIYFYRITAGNYLSIKKMILIK